jgi:hypothetical protein
MQSIKEYIKEGITIDKTNEGYRVFTIPTQHFNIKDLDELTADRFEEEIQKQREWQKLENDILGEYFKDLF